MTSAAQGRVSLVVLGCAKNQVEAESMSSRLAGQGWELTADLPNADVAVVHTCGFLEAARQEALDTVARVRRAAPRSFLVMTGCFAQYLGGKNPWGADAVLGTGQFHRLPEIISESRTANGGSRRREDPPARSKFVIRSSNLPSPGGHHDASSPRPLRRGQLSAYLRISEGCDHRCTFCVIPQLRGGLRSRPPEDILREARDLTGRGVRELTLISQDTTDYGRDLGLSLPGLLRSLLALKDLSWLRLLYAYPSEVGDELLDLLAGEPRLCGYLDMPLQHISDPILRSMARAWGEKETRALLDRLKARVPGLALRTTFIVGFPGETEDDFRKVLRLVEDGYFEHMGAFPYSPEERSPSARLPGRLPAKAVDERWNRLTDAQTAVMRRRAGTRRGLEIDVLAESSPEGGWTVRAPWQAPEVDGEVLLDHLPETAGFHRARLTGMKGVSLTADLMGKEKRVKGRRHASVS